MQGVDQKIVHTAQILSALPREMPFAVRVSIMNLSLSHEHTEDWL